MKKETFPLFLVMCYFIFMELCFFDHGTVEFFLFTVFVKKQEERAKRTKRPTRDEERFVFWDIVRLMSSWVCRRRHVVIIGSTSLFFILMTWQPSEGWRLFLIFIFILKREKHFDRSIFFFFGSTTYQCYFQNKLSHQKNNIHLKLHKST